MIKNLLFESHQIVMSVTSVMSITFVAFVMFLMFVMVLKNQKELH